MDLLIAPRAAVLGRRFQFEDPAALDRILWVAGEVDTSSGSEQVSLAIEDQKPCVVAVTDQLKTVQCRFAPDASVLRQFKDRSGTLLAVLAPVLRRAI